MATSINILTKQSLYYISVSKISKASTLLILQLRQNGETHDPRDRHMAELADSQEQLLLSLKQRGPQTAKALAEQLGITTMGARQHLAALSEKQLVDEMEEVHQGRGRPVKPWRLTDKAHQRFPDAHSQVTVDLIASVRDVFGEPGLDSLIEKRTEQTLQQYHQAVDKETSVAKKIKKLAELRTAEGYMAEVEKESATTWLLIENHCPICAAATACQGFCRSELETFQSLFKDLAEVERTDHILQGARRCAYKIQAKG